MACILLRGKGNFEKKGGSGVTTKAQNQVVQPQAKGPLHQKLEEARRDVFPRVSEGRATLPKPRFQTLAAGNGRD